MFVSVYQIQNKINDKSYIGISIDVKKRWNDHIKGYCKSTIYYAIKKYGKENFNFGILNEVDSWEQACKKEIYYIDKLDTYKNGYNNTLGGDGVLGLKSKYKGKTNRYSKETLKLISDSLKGRFIGELNPFYKKKHTDESKDRMSKSCKAAMTEERRKEISKFHKGRKHTEETKAKISEAGKGRIVSDGTKEKLRGRKHTEKSKRKMSNAQIGNKNRLGQKQSKETKNKISIANKGRKFSDDHKKKLSESHIGLKNNLGNKHTQKTKDKIAKKKQGQKHSELTKLKMSKSQIGRKHTDESKEKMKKSWIKRKLNKLRSN